MQEMLKENGAFAYLDPLDRANAIKSVVGLGTSCSVLSGMFVGLYLEIVGPKITALTGILLQGVGMSMLFFTSSKVGMAWGSIFMGFAFQAILNSHMAVSIFFPTRMSMVLAIIGAAPDVSLFVPAQMKNLADRFGGGAYGVRRVVLSYVGIIVPLCGLCDLLFVPYRAFDPLEEDEYMDEYDGCDDDLTIRTSSDLSANGSYGAVDNTTIAKQSPICYWDMTARQQLHTIQYWVFTPFFVINFCRRKYFGTNVRSIFEQIAGGDSGVSGRWVAAFNVLVPFGFLPAVGWGILSDRMGVTVSMLMSNAFGVGVSVFSLVPVVGVQALTLICYLLNSSYVFGLLFAFCATTYGFLTLATLQGVCSTMAGVVAIVMDLFWNDFVADVLNNNFNYATSIMLFIGLAMFATPVFLFFRPPPRDFGIFKTVGVVPPEISDLDFAHRHPTDFICTSGQVYDRQSLAAIPLRASSPCRKFFSKKQFEQPRHKWLTFARDRV